MDTERTASSFYDINFSYQKDVPILNLNDSVVSVDSLVNGIA